MLLWYMGKFTGKAHYASQVRRDSLRTSVHGRADFVLYPDPGSAGRYASILDYIDGRVPGVEIEGAGAERMAIIRGISTISGNPEALYLIDDVPSSRQSVNGLNPADVERIEVIRNPSGMALYGLRGGNGVIAIYTRRGSQGSFGEMRLVIIGFHESVTPAIAE
jgi:outer membrane receptor protein involved in Fe transport